MEVNFSNEYYRQKAMNAKQSGKSNHTVEDAFFLLIKDVDKEDLSNLCLMIKEHMRTLEKPVDLSMEDCYDLTQGKDVSSVKLDQDLRKTIVDLAYECIENGNTLGNKTIQNGKINTSSWMSHVLFEGKLAGELASKLGVDPETATIQGILHDYGRKETHSFAHVIRGYEKLVDEGWEEEAVASLTHSFFNGGRCASNEQAEEGFYVDDNGDPQWREGAKKDDITKFLENYQYSEYDTILNIADLMATSDGIVSPFDRIEDIATRRTLDPINRGYFLAEFTNKLVDILREIGAEVPERLSGEIKASKGVTLDTINQRFKDVSDLFFENYKKEIASSVRVTKPVSAEDIAKADIKFELTDEDVEDSKNLIDRLLDKDKGDR